LAVDTVANLPGVKSVDNRLEVKGGITGKNSPAPQQSREQNDRGHDRENMD
jgi:hypothetical protein